MVTKAKSGGKPKKAKNQGPGTKGGKNMKAGRSRGGATPGK
jgi:hypothetical protein